MEHKRRDDAIENLVAENSVAAAGKANAAIERVDLVERVMGRIAAVHTNHTNPLAEQHQHQRQHTHNRRRRRLPVAMAVASVLLLASVGAYAASQNLEIRDSTGELRITIQQSDQTSTLIPYVPRERTAQELLRDEVVKMANFGDLLAYYIAGNNEPRFNFLHNTRTQSYEEYAALAQRTGAPLIAEPSKLPEGLWLEAASVRPELSTSEYADVRELLEQRLAEQPDAELLVEPVAWDKAYSSELYYRNHKISLHLKQGVHVLRSEGTVEAGSELELLNIGGTEVAYTVSSDRMGVRYSATWYDEAEEMLHSVNASVNQWSVDGEEQVDIEEFDAKQFLAIVEEQVLQK